MSDIDQDAETVRETWRDGHYPKADAALDRILAHHEAREKWWDEWENTLNARIAELEARLAAPQALYNEQDERIAELEEDNRLQRAEQERWAAVYEETVRERAAAVIETEKYRKRIAELKEIRTMEDDERATWKAEVERLRAVVDAEDAEYTDTQAEVERLRRVADQRKNKKKIARAGQQAMGKELARLRAEVERLREEARSLRDSAREGWAEVERLREELAKKPPYFDGLAAYQREVARLRRIEEAAREAVEGEWNAEATRALRAALEEKP